MTKPQAEALAAFVTRVRPEWRQAGVLAALEKAAATADVHDVACALIRLAQDTTVHTPGLLPHPGPHWLKPDGSKPGRRGDHTMTCPDHGEPYLTCQQCAAIQGGPPPDDVRAEMQAAIEAAKTTHHQRDAAQAEREARKSA